MKIKYQTEYVIVGSGASGGIIFNEMQERKVNCILIESGKWHSQQTFKKNFLHSAKNLWVDAGYQFAKGSSVIPILQGSCIGGSTVINGSIMQIVDINYINKINEIFKNNSIFDIDNIYKHQEKVVALFKIKKNTEHVIKDSFLKKICQKLNWTVESQMRAAPQCEFSEHCLNGCPNNAKLTIENLILKKEYKNILHSTKVNKLILKKNKVTLVECQNEEESFYIKAKKIIICAGAIGSPKILLNSNINNKFIGKNFQCHLSTSITADFGHDKKKIDILPMGYQIKTNLDSVGTFFSQSIPEELLLSKIPVYGEDLIKINSSIKNFSSWVSSVSSKSKGSVSLDFFGNTKINFSPTLDDLKKILFSNYQISKFLFMLGAKKVYLPIHDFSICNSLKDLEKIHNSKLVAKNFLISSSHLFGSCSPSIEPLKGVIDKDFKVKNIDNLYVIDASSLPLPTSYNPQLAIMVIAKSAINYLLNK
jgi:choline dehydrogenase-like flavoprotein